MSDFATIYDICAEPLKRRKLSECGENFKKIYGKLIANPFLKLFVLKNIRHPGIPMSKVDVYRKMISKAAQAHVRDWDDPEWIEQNFSPLAQLLDQIEEPAWRKRKPVPGMGQPMSREGIEEILVVVEEDLFRIWGKNPSDPHIPLAAQVLISGDEDMTGSGMMNILKGLGNYEYKNITILFALLRVFLYADESALYLLRKPYASISEPLRLRPSWIWHRTAFYDVIFFEQLYNRVAKTNPDSETKRKYLEIMQSLIEYIVITSREWLKSPSGNISYPAITCLPKDEKGNPLCAMSKSDWKKKQDLGFGDYVPDIDTTYLGLTMAAKWLKLSDKEDFPFDAEILEQCEVALDHPWVEIVAEYQVGRGFDTNPPTITLARPFDYTGSVPLWLHKPFLKPDGRIVTEALGNEICPGHNMDILETILFLRHRFKTLEGENLKTAHMLLDFHHRLFTSGAYKKDSAVRFYLPQIYVNYAGRLYETYLGLSPEERKIFDPEGKVEEIRKIALDYFSDDILGYTANPFDASLAVSGLVLLRCPESMKGYIYKGLGVLKERLGEGGRSHPYKGYEWTMVRHPSRVLVGSAEATTLFVLNACVEALGYV